MAKELVTSDTHFGHANIIRYTNRPFADWRRMGESLIERWNRAVQPEDHVYFVGDFAMGPGATDDYVFSVLARLHGTTTMILGNHDQPSKWSRGLKALIESNRSLDRYTVLADQIHEVKIDGKLFVLSHYPMADWNGRFHGSVHLHGHTHTEFDADAMGKQPVGRYDIGVDMYGGPVQITGDLRYLNDPKGWA